MTKSAALEVAARGVRINAIAPGSTRTEMFDAWLSTEHAKAEVAAWSPMNHIALPDDMAASIREASQLTGRRRRSRQNANAPSNSVDDLQQNRLRKFGRQVSNEGAHAGQKPLPIRNQRGQHGIASKPRGQNASQRT